MTIRKTTRTKTLYVRITPAEDRLHRQAAKAAERDHADWVRWVLNRVAKEGK